MKLGPIDMTFFIAHSVMLLVVAFSGRRDLASAGGFLTLVWFASWPAYWAKETFDTAQYLMMLDGVGFCLTVAFSIKKQAIWPNVWAATYLAQAVASLFFEDIGRWWWLALLNVICAVQVLNVTFAALPEAVSGGRRKVRKIRAYVPTGIFSSPRAESAFPLPTQRTPPVRPSGAMDFGFNGPPPSY